MLGAMTESIEHTLDTLCEFLRTQGLTANGGAGADEIAAFERRYNIRLPDDVRAYFERVNGVVGGRDGAWDDEMIALWELSDVRPLNEEIENCLTPSAEQYFVFADWSIWAHGYALRLSAAEKEAPIFIASNPQVERVADSFDDFLRGYIRREPLVLFGAPLGR